VEDDGCILSEYPPGTPPNKWNFPRRNRIISGLSSGVLVVEAPEKSGSLITARLAGEQGRDVFVVPGNVDLPSFAGSYHLLREGATPVNSGWDILCEYEGLYPDKLRRDMTSLPRERTEEKVAQPQIKPQKTTISRPEREKERKITIDKAPPTPYIDLNETLPKLTQEERILVSALRSGPRQADDVIAETGLTTGKFLAAMTMLEIKGIVKRLPGKRIQLK
jgi:DNA processing protein